MIETERTILALPPVELAPDVAAYHQRNRDHFAASSPRRDEVFFLTSHWEEQLGAAIAEARAKTAFRFYLFERAPGRGVHPPILGHVAFTNIVRGPFLACHLGYGLDQGSVGKGLMSEALEGALAFAFDDLGLHRVMANYVPTNERSAKVLRRLGFVVEGYARDYLFLDGAWRDHVLTSRLASAPAG